MDKNISKILKSTTNILEIICWVIIGLYLLGVVAVEFLYLGKFIIPVNAVVTEAVDVSSIKLGNNQTFGPYYYNVKYKFNNTEITNTEPVKSDKLLPVGDKLDLIISGKNGAINKGNLEISNWIDSFLKTSITLGVFIIILRLVKKSINIIEDNTKNWWKGIKLSLCGIPGVVLCFLSFIIVMKLVFVIPNYFNETYQYQRADVIKVISQETIGLSKSSNLIVQYNYKGYRIQYNEWVSHTRPIDEKGIIVETVKESGEPIRNNRADVYLIRGGAISMILFASGLVLLLISRPTKIKFGNKNKTNILINSTNNIHEQ